MLATGPISSFIKDELGASAIEYGLIAALISTVIIVAISNALSGATN